MTHSYRHAQVSVQLNSLVGICERMKQREMHPIATTFLCAIVKKKNRISEQQIKLGTRKRFQPFNDHGSSPLCRGYLIKCSSKEATVDDDGSLH